MTTFLDMLGAFELKLARLRLPDSDAVPELPAVDAKLARVPVLLVLPLCGVSESEPSAAELSAIGLALSRLAIRRLMLRADLSVRGPEDTPAAGVAAPEQVPASLRETQHVLGGSLERAGTGYVAKVWLSAPAGSARSVELQAAALPELLGQLTATAALWLDSKHTGEQPHLRVLQSVTPSNEAGFFTLGTALLEVERSHDELEADELLLSALDRGPELSLLAGHLSRFHLHTKVRIHEAAPCDAQLCYAIAHDIWTGTIELGAARAYLLKALTLAPCHARGNAVAFRMAKNAELHRARAALGYALAPGSVFAAHQYALFLMRHEDPEAQGVAVASGLVALEPSDPVGLWALMTDYAEQGDTARAIESAERLLHWVDPLDPRAERHLRADRELDERMNEGWSLASEAKELIEKLKAPEAAQ